VKTKILSKKWVWLAVGLAVLLVCWPGALRLQMRSIRVAPQNNPDAVYLVCGASAQNRRIDALASWLKRHAAAGQSAPTVLIGQDPQKSLWCRTHQTNHTVTVWAFEKLELALAEQPAKPLMLAVPGEFSTTDGEMQALADYLRQHSSISSVALATSRYHARRCYERLQAHAPAGVSIGIIKGKPNWRDYSPITVGLEYAKIWRDRAGLSHAPLISRPSNSGSD
jgi:hypothetical protein